MKILFRKYFELTAWIAGLVSLALMHPEMNTHYSLCFFKFLGIKFCPGCGLGHSISFLFHGDLCDSFAAHPLGIFAVPVIFFRIYKLLCIHIFLHSQKQIHGQQF